MVRFQQSAINYSVPKALLGNCLTSNNNRMMLFSTAPYFRDRPVEVDYLDSDIFAISESGDIRIDKLSE